MKHTLLYILTVILLCGVTVSCKKDSEESGVTQETIIMFFPYSGLESDILNNIACMKSAVVDRGGLGKTRLIVYRALGTTSGVLYEIVCENGQCKDVTIADVSATFSSNDQESNIVKMQTVLEKVKEYAPANGYSMIIGCHGSSWVPAGTTLSSMNSKSLGGGSQVNAFGTASANRQIDNAALVTALKNSDMHLNFLMFDACYMASIEAAYEYRSVCDYYIASQNEIMSYGVPYDHLGDELIKHDYNGVVNKYYNFYLTYTTHGEKASYGSLSVTSTSNLEVMAAVVRTINTTCLRDVNIKDIQYHDGIRPAIFFDLKDYYDKACTDPEKLEYLHAAIKQSILFERHTPEFYTGFSSPDHRDATYSCGLNISQPTQNTTAARLIQSTDWWRDTH